MPACLLLDMGGNVVKSTGISVDIDRIMADAGTIDVSEAERLARAVPFRERSIWTAAPQLSAVPPELLDDGLERAAVMAFERAAQANPGAPTLYRLGTLLARSGERSGPAPRSSARSPCSRIWPRPTTISARCLPRRRSRRGRQPVSRGAGVDSGVTRRAEQSWLCTSSYRPRWRGSRALRKGAGAPAGLSRSAEQSRPAVRPGGRHRSSGALFP